MHLELIRTDKINIISIYFMIYSKLITFISFELFFYIRIKKAEMVHNFSEISVMLVKATSSVLVVQ